MRIGIRFKDNDFHRMNRAILGVLRDAIYESGGQVELTKERILEVYNDLTKPIYLLFQNCWQYKSSENTFSYIKITIDQIHINEEIDKFWEEVGDGYANHDYFYLDVDNNQIECW